MRTLRGPGRWGPALILLTVIACGPSAAQQWSEALDAKESGDPLAFDRWLAIAPDTPEGRHARSLLAQADAHYREGIRRLATGDDSGAYEEMREGVALAPMDPGYYPTVGRLFHERGNDVGAARVYARYLRARPQADDVADVRQALRDLDPSSAALLAVETAPQDESDSSDVVAAALGIAAGLIVAALVVLGWSRWRQRGVGLAQLVQERPELHPAIAYLVGSLRHELLKHRVGAAGDAVEMLASGRHSHAQIAFVQGRLGGGEPLDRAFLGYVRAFERALGQRFDAARDAGFRSASRAMKDITRIAPTLDSPSHRDVARLREAHRTLSEFDRTLKTLVDGLVRTEVDQALLEQVVDEVRGEYAVSRITLDELRVEPPEPGVHVEVFRVDLLVVLKNLVRNAVLAAGRASGDKRVAIGVAVELEMTGEETVLISVSDSSDELLTVDMIHDREFGRGLGLVAAAVSRYGGAISVEPAEGFAKSVVVSFSRAFVDEVGSDP